MDAVKVVTFDDGSNIITRISELRNEKGEQLCFLITTPFVLQHKAAEDGSMSVSFGPYNVYTQDTEIRIPFSCVRSITNPKKFIYDKYLEVLKPFDPVYVEKMTELDPGDPEAPPAVVTVPDGTPEETAPEEIASAGIE